MCRTVPIYVVLLALGWGCAQETGSSAALKSVPRVGDQWQATPTISGKFAIEPLGSVANSGLLLPTVSPDGQWVAYLQLNSDQPVDPKALFSGRGLEDVGLAVRPMQRGGEKRVVWKSGVSWPVWSADSRQLLFVSSDAKGRSAIGIYDLASGTSRHTGVGLQRMIMPALSPSGQQLAVVDAADLPTAARVYTVNLPTGSTEPGPPVQPGQRQLWPHWLDERTLTYVGWHSKGTTFYRWSAGAPPQPAGAIDALGSTDDALLLLASVSRPLSPDGRQVAFYDAAADQIVLMNLLAGRQRRLTANTRAGCWFGPDRFVAASDKDLLLFAEGADEPLRPLHGAWLPIWANPAANEIILCTRGADEATFELVRLRLVPRK